MIRVTSGTAKGKKLILPKNQKITAVKEVVKLAIFSILGDKTASATILDLFAGSGNLGIEALSRGASFCDFVDESKSSIETIEKNLKSCGLTDLANPIWDDVLKYLGNTQSMYDIIFADPYYANTNQKYLIKLAVKHLKPQGVFFLLTSSERQNQQEDNFGRRSKTTNTTIELPKDLPPSVTQETRRYGRTFLTMLTIRPQPV